MPLRILFVLSFLTLTLAHAQTASPDQKKQLEYTRSHYTKYEFRIPMRDGVKLFTSVYVPKDLSQQYPILMQRTPYSVAPYGIDNYRTVVGPSELAEKEGFIVVYQDVRGRYLSEGTFIDVPPHKISFSGPKDSDESTDTYDTIDWLVKNIPNNNGRVGMWGISYPGFYAAYGLMNAHPALKAVSPQAPMGDVGDGDDAYHNGAFHLSGNFGFYVFFKPRGPDPERPQPPARFDFGTQDQYQFYLQAGPLANYNERYFKEQNSYWSDLLKHPTYDEYWQSRAQSPHMKNVTPATLFVGGWFDAEDLSGPLKLFRAVEKDGGKAPNTIVMGPWCHGCWSRGEGNTLGDLNFASNTGEFFRENIELPFFVQNLKDKGDGLKSVPDHEIPKAWVFQTGTNEWHRFAAWPPKNAQRKALYLTEKGGLSFTQPAAQSADEYVSDPAKPVPIRGNIGGGFPGDYLTYDQRFASRRPDVLAYQTPPLEQDVTFAGPVTPMLKVATSGTDSDFIVKLIDVYPDDYPNPDPNPANVQMGGYQQLVRAEPFRGKFRNDRAKAEPFSPDKPAKIEYVMPDICHTFRTGHRIMVQIQSTWFPMIDLNPQQFENIPTAKSSDFVKATERLYHGGADGSRLAVFTIGTDKD